MMYDEVMASAAAVDLGTISFVAGLFVFFFFIKKK